MKIVNYGRFSQQAEVDVGARSGVTELHWDDGRVVQISGAEDEDSRGKHVLIRVFPANGTSEYGGGNLTSFYVLLNPDGDDWVVNSMDVRRKRG